MLTIINMAECLADCFPDRRFTIERWNKYIDTFLPSHKSIFTDDMQEAINAGGLTFESDFMPVLNGALGDKESRERAISAFLEVTDGLEEKILKAMGKPVDATVILYLGLCNGAGWVVDLDSHRYVLLGIEKIIELGRYGVNDMYGLIYHELGHIYQMQHGKMVRSYKNSETFLYQLFTEGIAMVFEQKLIGCNDYFHQDKNGWARWCAANLAAITADFNSDLANMTRDNQRYFGDWVDYKGHSDVGYYLGARFVQWLNKKYRFDDMLSLDIHTIRSEWSAYSADTKKYRHKA